MKKIVFIIIIVATICFSCDFYALHSLSIDNQTNDTIKIVFVGKSPYKMMVEDSLYFPPLQKKAVYEIFAPSIRNGCDYTGIKKEEIEINTSSGRILKKDIWSVNNWDCKGSFSTGWKQTFVITEEDLE